ncbi:hypothetical protein G6F24_011668 [Rhizopus arrhizus]|nr:hypothetical protein G6F24_011668 [Rhizopus arrhizus]
MELKVAFALCLKELRSQRYLAQVDLGHQAHVSRLESGKQEATLTTFEQMADALGMSSIELFARVVAIQSGQDPSKRDEHWPETQHEYQQRNSYRTAGQHADEHEQQTNEAHQVHGAILLVG